MKIYKKIMEAISKAEKTLQVVIGITITALAFANVCVRHLTSGQLAFTEEVTINIFVLMIMCGCALSAWEGSLISLSLVYDLVGPKARKVMSVISTVLSCAFYLTLGCTGWLKILDLFAKNRLTSALLIPEGLFMMALPLGCILLILHSVEHMLDICLTEELEEGAASGGETV